MVINLFYLSSYQFLMSLLWSHLFWVVRMALWISMLTMLMVTACGFLFLQNHVLTNLSLLR
jgi:hypothetical protein